MGLHRAWGTGVAIAFLTSLFAAPSCTSNKGALMLAISTDMQAPKDISVVSVYVTTSGVPKFDYLGRVQPDGTVALPSTLAIVEPDEQGAEVRIRVIGFQEQKARVLRDVLTTVPHQRTVLLRLPLNFLDDGSVTGTLPQSYLPAGARNPNGAPEGDTAFQPDDPDPTAPDHMNTVCDFTMQQTSIAGQCEDAHVASSALPDYGDALVYGDGGSMLNPVCFDVPTCFSATAPAQVSMSGNACSFPLPQGTSPASVNVALATQGTGAPVAGRNLVPLESDAGEGFTVQGQTVSLVPGVCKKLQVAGTSLVVAASGGCAPKTESTPVCEPTSTLDAGGVADSGASDSSAPPGDSGAMDAGGHDSSVGCPAGTVLCGGACTASCQGGDGGTGGGTDGGDVCSGVCTTLASSQGATGVAVDSTNVYWTDGNAYAVMSMPLAGGTPITLASTGSNVPTNIAVDATNVYWVDMGGNVGKVPVAGGMATTLGTSVNAFDLAIDATNVYWTDDSGGRVLKVPIAGGSVTTLASGQSSPYGIAVNSTTVFWVNGVSAQVMSVPVAGGTASTLASRSSYFPEDIALDSQNVYWTESFHVMSMPLAGGTPTTLASGLPGPYDIAIDSMNVYWTDTSGVIGSVPLGGGTPTTLATTLTSGRPWGIAVDATSVYWAVQGAKAGVMKVTPK
jgi:hypothetical protein